MSLSRDSRRQMKSRGANVRQSAHLARYFLEDPSAVRGESIGVATLDSLERFDESNLFEARDGAVERARAQCDSREVLDVFEQRVPVFRT